ncbi:uncharacterized protein LOC134698600 [Mytilus trossulus]|uniref:uncharacterized protein LOC134698600 n=1 Tax=Mytilus trossulus TaxID=6551 RepID=UPI003003E39D
MMTGQFNQCAFDENCKGTELFSLKECNKDTISHLRFFKCGTDMNIPESLLILNRAGLGLRLSNVIDKYICNQHRQQYGLQWKRKKRTCCHPLHDIAKSAKVARGINLTQSREIWLKFNLNIAVGSGVCRRCIESHKNELQIGTHMKEELREICSFLENATDRIDTVENVTGTIELVTGNGENEEDNNSEACSAISNTEFAADGKLEDIMMDTAMSMDSEPDLFSSQTISQATATSSWSRDERSQKEIFNWAMEVMSNGQYPTLKSQASIEFEELQYSTKMYYIRQARSAFEIVCENIAPSQGLELMTQVCHSMKLKTSESKQKDALTETIISAYNKAEDHTTKVQVLSLIVEKYSKSELLSFIQGLTIYKIDAARKYAATHGPGQYVTPPKITRIRLPKQKIHHFIEFISSPCYLQIVGFGSRHLKLSSGLVVKVPKVIRTMIASRLINAYTNYCKENSIIPPCRATQFKIIKACAASQLKSLHGLDNYISDGMDSIDTLKKVVSNLGTNGMITSKVDDLNESLDTLKLHLKNEFQNHLSSESDCNEHCIHLALSEKGCEHVHTTTCQPCSRMYQIKDELQNLMTSNFPDINSKEKEEFEHDISVSTEKIWAWRDHLIRTVNQDSCKKDLLQNLQSHEVLIIADWAMKYIPQTFRETQSEWFGKQGISWHMICALVRKPQSENDSNDEDDKNYDIYSMVHIVEEQKQGWHIVSQIFSSAFKMLKSIHPHLRDVYIRSDNAGCYHALPLLSYLWKFRNDLSLNVKQYNFSEAQSGKDLCDSRTGTCRLHMLNFINEGNDITNGMEMKQALESHGGIRNTYISVVTVASETQPVLYGQIKNLQISKFNNFSFEDEGMIAYKAYGIEGELVKATDMTRISNKLMIFDTNLTIGDPKQPEEKPASKKAIKQNSTFPCFEPDCLLVFKKEDQLITHISIGKHVFDNEKIDNISDTCKRLWYSKCQDIRFLNKPLMSTVGSEKMQVQTNNNYSQAPGYALKKRKKAVRFSPKVKEYLIVLFNVGEESGKKPSPYTVSKQMRNETDLQGDRIFSPSEWLSHQQIRSFFGNLCMKKQTVDKSKDKSVKLVKIEDNQEDDEDLQNVLSSLEANEHNTILSEIVSVLTV